MNLVPSALDVNHLELIRNSVSKFQREMYELLCGDVGCRILDVAPQVHGGVASVPGCKHNVSTLDIDPKSGASYVHDLCEPLPENLYGMFDVVFCTEVLEHTRQPFVAAESLLGMVSTGGHIVVTTPCNFRIHGPLPDCWRFTEHGLRELFKSASFVSIRSIETPNRPLFPIGYQTLVTK